MPIFQKMPPPLFNVGYKLARSLAPLPGVAFPDLVQPRTKRKGELLVPLSKSNKF